MACRLCQTLLLVACASQPVETPEIVSPPRSQLPPVACQGPKGPFLPGLSMESVAAQVGFEDVTARLGQRGPARGVSLVDFDLDGWPDVSLAGERGVELYRNLGDGEFEDVSSRFGMSRLTLTSPNALTWGDIDGDGDLDLFLTRYSEADELVLWDGDEFQRAGEAWGLPAERRWSTTASLGDLDGDGDLDVYVATGTNPIERGEEPDDNQGERDLVYRNDGGRFTEVALDVGLAGPEHGSTFVGLVVDFDDDGDVDVFAIHDFRPDELYLGDGGGRFARASTEWLPEQATSLMGLDVGDVDGDGRLDVYATNFGPDVLYRQGDGVPHFAEQAGWLSGPDPTDLVVGWGCALLDFENDGDLDAVSVAATDPYSSRGSRGEIPLGALIGLENHGGAYADAGDRLGPSFQRLLNGYGLARGDFDGDGREDLLVGSTKEGGLPPGVHTSPLLLRNVSSPVGASVTLTLRQPEGANRFAVGARVDLVSRHPGGQARNQTRVVLAGSSYLSSVSYSLVFGLGDGEVEAVRVRWPDGATECLGSMPPGRWLVERGAGASPELR